MNKTIIDIAKAVLPYSIINNEQNKVFRRSTPIQTPKIFNPLGEKMELFYLQDYICKMQPYGFVAGRYPRNILWDRFNKALDVQFYTHNEILKLSPYIPKKRFAYFIESEVLTPKSYALLYNNKTLSNEFSTIFTTSDRHLNELPNAKFLPAGGVWYGVEGCGGVIKETLFEEKTKDISIVSSAKTQCDLHKFRIELSRYLKKNEKVDVFGTFDGGTGVKIGDSLQKYRYSIVIENNISDYYFTEKILNCFASMTIPIYIGARKISDYFNSDGIVCINDVRDFSEIDIILNKCNKEFYNERLNAIKENYNTVQEFTTIEDYLYKKYCKLISLS